MGLELHIDVFNDGTTKAFNVKASGYMTTKPMTPGVAFARYGNDLKIAKVIGVIDTEHSVRVALASAGFGSFLVMDESDWQAVQDEKMSLQMIGTISYDDVFREASPLRRFTISGRLMSGGLGKGTTGRMTPLGLTTAPKAPRQLLLSIKLGLCTLPVNS